MTPKEKAHWLISKYGKSYCIQIAEIRMMVAMADDVELIVKYWELVLEELSSFED